MKSALKLLTVILLLVIIVGIAFLVFVELPKLEERLKPIVDAIIDDNTNTSDEGDGTTPGGNTNPGGSNTPGGDLLDPDGDPNANIQISDIYINCMEPMVHDDDWGVDIYNTSTNIYWLWLSFSGKLDGMGPQDVELKYSFENVAYGTPLFQTDKGIVEGEFFSEGDGSCLCLWDSVDTSQVAWIRLVENSIQIEFITRSGWIDENSPKFVGIKDGKAAYCRFTVTDEISGCSASINLRIPEEVLYL